MAPREVMRSGSAPARPGSPKRSSSPNERAPRMGGAAAPRTGQSARLVKEQPGETHAHRVAHLRRSGGGPGHPPGPGGRERTTERDGQVSGKRYQGKQKSRQLANQRNPASLLT